MCAAKSRFIQMTGTYGFTAHVTILPTLTDVRSRNPSVIPIMPVLDVKRIILTQMF